MLYKKTQLVTTIIQTQEALMQPVKVVIIEDEPDILELIQYNLEKNGYHPYPVVNGEQGVSESVRLQPDAIILDLMLPGIDGLEVCRQLRQHEATKHTPILMLTAKSEESDVVVGLELGADEYMTKPFSPRELIARLRALLRRSRMKLVEPLKNTFQIGPLTIDHERHEAFYEGNSLPLTLTEFKLLSALIQKPGRVFTRDQLLEKINGGDTYVIDRNIDVHIRAIRRKLGNDADMIKTVRGVGYKCHS